LLLRGSGRLARPVPALPGDLLQQIPDEDLPRPAPLGQVEGDEDGDTVRLPPPPAVFALDQVQDALGPGQSRRQRSLRFGRQRPVEAESRPGIVAVLAPEPAGSRLDPAKAEVPGKEQLAEKDLSSEPPPAQHAAGNANRVVQEDRPVGPDADPLHGAPVVGCRRVGLYVERIAEDADLHDAARRRPRQTGVFPPAQLSAEEPPAPPLGTPALAAVEPDNGGA